MSTNLAIIYLSSITLFDFYVSDLKQIFSNSRFELGIQYICSIYNCILIFSCANAHYFYYLKNVLTGEKNACLKDDDE